MSSGVTSQGARALISSAAGTRISLLISDPRATAQTTGSSRSALTPVTCCAFSARSSPSTPAVFFAASLVITDTSSSTLAMSSSRVNRLAPATSDFLAPGIEKGPHGAWRLADQPPAQRIAVGPALIGPDTGDDRQHQRHHTDQRHQRKADQCPGQQAAHHHGNAVGDLEVQGLAPLIVNEGIRVLLQLPDHQRTDDIADHRCQHPEEGRVVAQHGPLARFLIRHGNQTLLAHRYLRVLPAQSARAARCSSNSSRMPCWASASMAFSSSGWKGAPSAVPCTSIKPPLSVITTLRSVSAAESSR